MRLLFMNLMKGDIDSNTDFQLPWGQKIPCDIWIKSYLFMLSDLGRQ